MLQYWVIKEAAIKWQQGTLTNDISQWSFSKSSNLARHQLLGHEIGLHTIHYDSWYIAVAYDQNLHNHPPILCHW